MAGGAAGGFVARAFESMLKECSNKKYNALQYAIQTYLDSGKEFNRHSNGAESKPAAANQSSSNESDSGAQKVDMGSDSSSRTLSAANEVDPTSMPANSSESITTILAHAGHTLGEAEAELVLNPLRLAFESKNTKVVELALDCLHKLIEYNHLEGDPGLEGGKNSKLLTDILKMICSCVDNSALDSTTLQVLKVLLTAIASTKIRVHGVPLLEVIRTCFNIALNSKSPISQATSKSMLTQMLSLIFRSVASDAVSSNSCEPKKSYLENGSNSMVEVLSIDHNDPKKALNNVIFMKQKNNTSLALHWGTKTLANSIDTKGLEAILQKAVDVEDDGGVTRVMGLLNTSVEQRDALLIFRTLCKMGMKVGNDESTTKTRILSLELLQGLLEDDGCSFMKNPPFIDLMRAHLSYPLLQASTSKSPALLQHVPGIFSVLLLRFRESFKAEIGVLFHVIVLRSLDGSDLNQKLNVLRMLEKVCKDPQMLVEIYLNYDCDPKAPNLFDRMVATLSKFAQGTQNMDTKFSAASQAASNKISSLQGLVNVLKALVLWEKSNGELNKQNKIKRSFSYKELDESKYKGDPPENFETLKAHEFTIEDIISEFNQQSGKAIQHLISSKLVENTPSSVAQFLRNTPKLDKAMIGNFLGENEEFSIAVMHAYVESMSYSGMKFEVALQEFLDGFQLPGEALKIDRIMEKFTERYCAENSGRFKNAHTAYVLAYAIIMLKAGGHNPMMQSKMSKSDFISMNTAYSDEGSAPHQELLEEVYDSVVKEQMELKDETSGNLCNSKQLSEIEVGSQLINILNLSLAKRNSSTDSKSVSEMISKQIHDLLKEQGGDKGVVFYTSSRIELICPMVEAVGWPLLAAFAVNIGEVENAQRISICMEGLQEGIHITHVLGMDTMRYAFLTSLLRYNSLHAPKEIRSKNVEALRTVLALCDTEMYALEGSWLAVLESISRLDYIISWPAMTASIMQGANQTSRDTTIQSLKELAGKPTEQVFLNSTKLPSESVVEFFSALCSVSVEELKQNPARIYSLQRLVEASYYNMARIRMVWARIWSILAKHFILSGSHADDKVATYAIDSVRKLGMKYLERDELASFTFQNDILKPFVVLMRSCRSESIRKLILDSIVRVIKSKVEIKSGWHSVFMVFTTAANDDQEPLVEQAFENVEHVILEHFDQIIGICLMDCVNCLLEFSKNKSSCGISLKAIALLHICANRLSEGLKQGDTTKHNDITADETCEHYWFPMLAALSDLTSDSRSEVTNCAVEVLFDLLNERGSKFSPSFWENIFQRVLFPIFDQVRHAGEESLISSGEEWHRESCIHALQLLCKLFNTFYKDVSFMLSPLLELLLECAKKSDQTIVSISLGALVHLIEVGGHQFSDHDWDTLLKCIRDASYTTQPLELLNDLGLEAKHHKVLTSDLDVASLKSSDNGKALSDNQATERLADTEGSEGPSPSGRASRPSDGDNLLSSQTFGHKIMENMKDNLLLRSFTLRPKSPNSDVMPSPAPPSKLHDTAANTDERDEEDTPMLRGIRSKCMTQLLLLDLINGIQQKYWDKLNTQNKITVMEVLFSVLEFSASYNSYTNLRSRMHQIPAERPPLNLLRQELSGTCIYLEILVKTTAAINGHEEEAVKENKIKANSEEKLVSFCEQVLRDASDFQSSMEETTDMDVHRVIELRSPITVRVLKGMQEMNPEIFKDHLNEFYPSLTKLVCCEQMDIRNALADLLISQLGRLLPEN